MNIDATVATTPASLMRPTFSSVVNGEIFKLGRQRTTWILTILLGLIALIPYPFYLLTDNIKDNMQADPANFVDGQMNIGLIIFRVVGGVFITILTVRVIGLEYQHGTIRVLLARGIGRVHLLGAKLVALTLAVLAATAGILVLNLVMAFVVFSSLSGNTHFLTAVDGAFWTRTLVYTATVLISLLVTMLLATAATVLGRSVAFGMGIGLALFPGDNIGVGILFLINRLTNNDFWGNITFYFLGPNLNTMPTRLVPQRVVDIQTPVGVAHQMIPAFSVGTPPIPSVDGTHTLVVALVYAAIFAAVAFYLTWKRDVLQ